MQGQAGNKITKAGPLLPKMHLLNWFWGLTKEEFLTQGQKDSLAANLLSVIKIADDHMDNDWFQKSTELRDGG